MVIPKTDSRDQIVACLQSALSNGNAGLDDVPRFLSQVLKKRLWAERVMNGRADATRFKSFEEFVRAKPRPGLGSSIGQLKDVCRRHIAVLDLIDQATARGDGRPKRETVDNVHGYPERPAGNAREAALRRLRRDRPDLHAKVLAGEKTCHGAMVEAGFRKKPTALEIARRAVAKLSEAEWRELVAWREER